MKNCINCNTPLPDDAAFCTKCGTQQKSMVAGSMTNVVKNDEQSIKSYAEEHSATLDTAKSVADTLLKVVGASAYDGSSSENEVSTARKGVLVFGALVVCLSVFSTVFYFKAGIMKEVTLAQLSASLTLTIFMMCGSALYFMRDKKYNIAVIVGNALVLYFIFAVNGLQNLVDEMHKIPLLKLGFAMGMSVQIGDGAIYFLLGAVIFTIGGVLCSLASNGKSIASFPAQWFYDTFKPLGNSCGHLPGVIVSLLLAGFLMLFSAKSELVQDWTMAIDAFNNPEKVASEVKKSLYKAMTGIDPNEKQYVPNNKSSSSAQKQSAKPKGESNKEKQVQSNKTNNSEKKITATAPKKPTVEFTPTQREAVTVLEQFHKNITEKNYRNAYACLSSDFQNRMTYDGWAPGFKTTVSSKATDIKVASETTDKIVLTYNLEAVDNPGGTQNFNGEVTLVKAGSDWKISEIVNKVKK